MVDIILKCYSKLLIDSQYFFVRVLFRFFRLSMRLFVNIVLPVYFRCTSANKKYSLVSETINIRPKIIISLTSFPGRINRLWLVIETLLRQKVKPDVIILWLSKEQFPSLLSVPKSLLKLQKRGLKIELRDGDLRSHKKYLYAFNEYPEYSIVTVDDDIFYPTTLLSSLLKASEHNPNCIVANYLKQIQYNEDGFLKSYLQWPHINNDSISSSHLFFGSGGGVLFPPQSLHSDLLKKDLFMRLTPYADDIWLNTMARLAGTAIVPSTFRFCLLPVMNFRDVTLSSVNNNVENPMNDIQLENIRNYYNEKLEVDPFKN